MDYVCKVERLSHKMSEELYIISNLLQMKDLLLLDTIRGTVSVLVEVFEKI
jgi:hypothetical protein